MASEIPNGRDAGQPADPSITADDDLPELTDRQKEVLALLPRSKPEIAERMGVKPTTVEGHIDAIQAKGVGLEYDFDANNWHLSDPRAPKLRRISTKAKGTKTREANELIQAEESILLRRLRQTEPLTATPTLEPDSETFCTFLSDLHMGDLVETDRGRVVYDVKTARECIRKFTEKNLEIIDLEGQYTSFDDCYLFLGGDIATGEGIYEGQTHDVEAHLTDQVTESVMGLYELAVTLADRFETLHIRGVMGNHGEVRASGVSKAANTDLITYRWLDDALRRDGVDNVSVEIAEATHHLNTKVRNWRVHMRHGQDSHRHVDKTAASGNKWRGWLEAHNYDLAMRGHWHNPGLDWVLNRYPVITAPSPKPGSEYIERMGSPDVADCRQLGVAWGMADKRPLTFFRLLDDR